uniref:Leucine-rich repeat-containing G-protein coupled receptor 5-like protein n=1 Tax=Rhynchophorus ferrugineus TaxID=354439 RepID=A0A5Q0TWX4_RHYFE|nr:leucine-rich repeat-containing G-protein coupled receptor 5-like protein [Rhynchophorus ferrugineus]
MWLFLIIGALAVAYSIACPDGCSCDLEIIDCMGLDLSNLPEGIDINVTDLDVSWNNFTTIPDQIKQFSELRYFNISHNRISTLMPTDFEGLEKLESLDLSFNRFQDWRDIHPTTFHPAINLKRLDFSSNPLRTINNQSNHLNIKSLLILRLTNCSLKTVPVSVFNRLVNLKELHLSANPITNINESFQLNNLRYIDLSQCLLNYIDENAFADLVSLEVLNLKRNIHLKRFTCHSEYLSQLDLSECVLEKVPSGRLRHVRILDLSMNYIKNIPAKSFLNYHSLELLNMSMNAITSIDSAAFDGLNLIKSIDLSFNKLMILDEKLFYNNTQLISLNLSHNYIRYLNNISSDSLKVLTVSYCEIHEINKYSLIFLPNLIKLFMSRNFISNLPDNLIADNLGVLDVSSCRIKSINNKTFAGMFYLREINLANNALTSIDPSFFPRATNVVIYENPWRCECASLKRMFEWITTYNADRLDELICYSPEKYAGKTWQEVCMDQWYPKQLKKETMWYYSVGIIILMILALVVVTILRKIKDIKEERIRVEHENRRAEEREALRRMQEAEMEIEEQENRNAPDPRDLQRPPSYTEALLMPVISASQPNLTGSLHNLASRQNVRGSNPDLSKLRKKRIRKKSEERRASRMTLDSDSSYDNQSRDYVPPRKNLQALPLESDF